MEGGIGRKCMAVESVGTGVAGIRQDLGEGGSRGLAQNGLFCMRYMNGIF